MSNARSLLFYAVALAAGFSALDPSAFAQTIAITPTFNNLGIVVTLPAPTTQTLVRMFMKTNGAPDGDYRELHPLSRLTSTRFVGSAFG